MGHKVIKDEIWTTKEGKEIYVCDMDEEHVRNVLRFIIRKQRELEMNNLLYTGRFDEDEIMTDWNDGEFYKED